MISVKFTTHHSSLANKSSYLTVVAAMINQYARAHIMKILMEVAA